VTAGTRDLVRILIGAASVEEIAGGTCDDIAALRARVLTLNPNENPILPVSSDVRNGLVYFQEFPRHSLDEPFLCAASARCAIGTPLAFAIEVQDIRGVAENGTAGPDLIILHTGRSGSTLLANLLSSTTGCLCVKEPEALMSLIAAWLGASSDHRLRLRVDVTLIVSLLTSSLRRAWGHKKAVVLKLAAWNTIAWPELVESFPDTPIVFLHRPAEDVISSLVASRPGWHDLLYAPKERQVTFFPSIRAERHAIREPVALFAHAWRSIVEAARALPQDTILLSYDSLRRNPIAALSRVLSRVSNATPPDPSQIAKTMARYSKSTDPAETFDAGSTHRRLPLDEAARERVRLIVDKAAYTGVLG
jgi:LPS sulfotransferase NodH